MQKSIVRCFRRAFALCIAGIMVFGMVNVAYASPEYPVEEPQDETPLVYYLEVIGVDGGINLTPPRIFIAGDSTAEYNPAGENVGWAVKLPDHIIPGGPTVVSHARSGESTSSFIASSRFDAMMNAVEPDDYIFIQFAHNDQAGQEFTTFQDNLQIMIDAVRAAGAIPVLVTPMARRNFPGGGSFVCSHTAFPIAVRQLAQREGVALIDMTARSNELLIELGYAGSQPLFLSTSNSHLTAYGAQRMAHLVAGEIRRNIPMLAGFLIEGDADFGLLQFLINYVDNLDEREFTNESWTAMQPYLDEARLVLADNNTTQAQVDAAWENLQDAVDALARLPNLLFAGVSFTIGGTVIHADMTGATEGFGSASVPVMPGVIRLTPAQAAAMSASPVNNITGTLSTGDSNSGALRARVHVPGDSITPWMMNNNIGDGQPPENDFRWFTGGTLHRAQTLKHGVVVGVQYRTAPHSGADDRPTVAVTVHIICVYCGDFYHDCDGDNCVDFSALQMLVDYVDSLNEDGFTDESWAAMQPYLVTARLVLAGTGTSQAAVNVALDNLQDAVDALVTVLPVYIRWLSINGVYADLGVPHANSMAVVPGVIRLTPAQATDVRLFANSEGTNAGFGAVHTNPPYNNDYAGYFAGPNFDPSVNHAEIQFDLVGHRGMFKPVAFPSSHVRTVMDITNMSTWTFATFQGGFNHPNASSNVSVPHTFNHGDYLGLRVNWYQEFHLGAVGLRLYYVIYIEIICPYCGDLYDDCDGVDCVVAAPMFTVTFAPAGGTRTGGGELVQTIEEGDDAVAPVLTRTGYNFAGWSASFANVTGDITITALWTQILTPPQAPSHSIPPMPPLPIIRPTPAPTTAQEPPTVEPPPDITVLEEDPQYETLLGEHVYVEDTAIELVFTIGHITFLRNGVEMTGVAAPFMDYENSRMMVPVRTVAEALGIEVDWCCDTRSALIFHPDGLLSILMDVELPESLGVPTVVDSRAFIPLRFIMYAFGARVDWDSENQAGIAML